MKFIKHLLIVVLFAWLNACVSNPSDTRLANDEDTDIGIGGTGMLANTKADSGIGGTGMLANNKADSVNGLGGTGVVGVITGFGSIFVNGIEIEYDATTPFNINGKRALTQQLAIGDIVEVLTTDNKSYTHAQVINLRHEVIGEVESVAHEKASFVVNGQTVLKSVNSKMPDIGQMVAVAGFKLANRTIQATRVTPANTLPAMVRNLNTLPFADRATRWLIQTNVQQNKFSFMINDRNKTFVVKEQNNASLSNRISVKILQLEKTNRGNIELSGEIDAFKIPRGNLIEMPANRPGPQRMQKSMPMRMDIKMQPVMPRFGR